jgi:hypothetical protein
MSDSKQSQAVIKINENKAAESLAVQGIAAYLALINGWVIEYIPDSPYLTPEGNNRVRWTVKRNLGFPAPYGCDITANGKREYKDIWTGPDLAAVLAEASSDLSKWRKSS